MLLEVEHVGADGLERCSRESEHVHDSAEFIFAEECSGVGPTETWMVVIGIYALHCLFCRWKSWYPAHGRAFEPESHHY